MTNKKQSVNADCYALTPDETAQYVTLSKDYGHNASVAVSNMSDKEVFVVACQNATQAAAVAFPTIPAAKTTPVKGQPVAANGGSISYDLPPGTTHVTVIHPSSGGTGNVYINIDSNGGE